MLAHVPHDEAVASLAESKNCGRVVFYDDTWRGIPEFQRGTLSHTCTYERVLYTAALASRSVPSVALLRRTPRRLNSAGQGNSHRIVHSKCCSCKEIART